MNKLILATIITIAFAGLHAQAENPADTHKARAPLSLCKLEGIHTPNQSSCQTTSDKSFNANERTLLDRTLSLARGNNQIASGACILHQPKDVTSSRR